ncbi:hypothetical protein PRUPE_3G040100 [Prunus persica]|uniref:Uncharacterized protein n=1 Tax=Prunus persica TaxID=3760 RepID=A0A251PY28_PRUPE|nr:hypothetical protein PRUPE_3G040100 [Prunus persica]
MWITKFRVVVGCKRGSYMKILHSTVRDACINGNWHARVDFSFMSDCEVSKPQGERIRQVRARLHQMHVPKQNNTPEDKTKVEGNWI